MYNTLKITNESIREVIAKKFKAARINKNCTQEYLAEQCDVSVDLIRNIENARNSGSISTILTLCNYLNIAPNDLFYEFLIDSDCSHDINIQTKLNQISETSKNSLKELIIYLDKNYFTNK